MRTPLLIFSDAVSASSGLARITRDLATQIATNLSDVFQVGTVGYGGCGSQQLPFTQYSWAYNDEWIIHDLCELWRDFAGSQDGIFLAIQDPSRMLWFARPETCSDERVRNFLKEKRFKKWGYLPIDASGPNGKLCCILKECLMGYDRLLCYSQWAETTLLKTLGIWGAGERDLQHLPHGIDTSVFYPRGRAFRQIFGELVIGQRLSIAEDETLIGVVATNQPRKDFGLVAQVCSSLAEKRKIRLWVHTDAIDRYWRLPSLFRDFELKGTVLSLGSHSDDTMAKLYSSCDVTLAPGLGEGFGYPIFESLACGTPVVHGDYGGAAEHLAECFKVKPHSYRIEGQWGCVRPVFRVEDWVEKVENALSQKALLPADLAWTNNWPKWEKWLRKGAEA